MLEEETLTSDSRNKGFSIRIVHPGNFWEDHHFSAHIQGVLALFVYLAGSSVAIFLPLKGSIELVEKILEEIPFSSKDIYGWIKLVWLEFNSWATSKGDITTIGTIYSTKSKYNQGG